MDYNNDNIPHVNTQENTPFVNSPLNDSERTELEEKLRKKFKLMQTLIFLMCFLFFSYFAYSFGSEMIKKEEERKASLEEQRVNLEKLKEKIAEKDKEPELVKFEGKYLYAEVPQGWSVKEFEDFFDGEGKPYKYDQFKGLATLNIYKGNKEMLSLSSVLSVPEPGVPNELRGKIFRFKDYSPQNENEVIEDIKYWLPIWNEGRKEKIMLEIVDYTNVNYSEVKILGGTVRRVGNILFQDAQSFDNTTTFENTTFEASASSTLYIFHFPCTSVSVGIYYQFAEGITEPDLLIIDKILQSLKPNCSN